MKKSNKNNKEKIKEKNFYYYWIIIGVLFLFSFTDVSADNYSFYRTDSVDGLKSIVWINTSIPAYSNLTIYISNFNQTVPMQSTTNIFSFFDDMNGASLNTSNWDTTYLGSTGGNSLINISVTGGPPSGSQSGGTYKLSQFTDACTFVRYKSNNTDIAGIYTLADTTKPTIDNNQYILLSTMGANEYFVYRHGAASQDNLLTMATSNNINDFYIAEVCHNGTTFTINEYNDTTFNQLPNRPGRLTEATRTTGYSGLYLGNTAAIGKMTVDYFGIYNMTTGRYVSVTKTNITNNNIIVTLYNTGSTTFTGIVKLDNLSINATNISISDAPFPQRASGGIVTVDGNYTVHTFTNNGTFISYENNINATILVVAGGGGGAKSSFVGGRGAGGGGSGGLLYNISYNINSGNYNVVIGTGGPGGSGTTGIDVNGKNGTNSLFNNIIAIGGGGGGGHDTATNYAAYSGGSGGGGSNNAMGGNGTLNQGNNGGAGTGNGGCGGTTFQAGGGGGGSGSIGYCTINTDIGGQGGNGTNYTINGINTCYSAGGGAYGINGNGIATCGAGAGSTGTNSGTNGTGSGGGASNSLGGTGGTGIVIVRYLSASSLLSYTITISGQTTNTTGTSLYNTSVLLINTTINNITMSTVSNYTAGYSLSSPTSIFNNSLYVLSAFFYNATNYYGKSTWINITDLNITNNINLTTLTPLVNNVADIDFFEGTTTLCTGTSDCVIACGTNSSTNIDVGGYNITFIGIGKSYVTANITNYQRVDVIGNITVGPNLCIVDFGKSGFYGK